jgi:hypothetical protein
MQEILVRKLHDYIRENNPDLLLILQQEKKVTEYLKENVRSVNELMNHLLSENRSPLMIEDFCIEELTRPLRPSRFNYLKKILAEEFPNDFERLHNSRILTPEVINMIAACDPVFDEMSFSEENEDDRHLRYAIMGAVSEYVSLEYGI